jgi:hypothetical protein
MIETCDIIGEWLATVLEGLPINIRQCGVDSRRYEAYKQSPVAGRGGPVLVFNLYKC